MFDIKAHDVVEIWILAANESLTLTMPVFKYRTCIRLLVNVVVKYLSSVSLSQRNSVGRKVLISS